MRVRLANNYALEIGLTMQGQDFLSCDLRKAMRSDGYTMFRGCPMVDFDQHVSESIRHLAVWRMARV